MKTKRRIPAFLIILSICLVIGSCKKESGTQPPTEVTEEFSGTCGQAGRHIFNMSSEGLVKANFKELNPPRDGYIVLCKGEGYPCEIGDDGQPVSVNLPAGRNSVYVGKSLFVDSCTYTIQVTHPR